jgi:hypothetical protein
MLPRGYYYVDEPGDPARWRGPAAAGAAAVEESGGTRHAAPRHVMAPPATRSDGARGGAWGHKTVEEHGGTRQAAPRVPRGDSAQRRTRWAELVELGVYLLLWYGASAVCFNTTRHTFS